MNVTGAQAYSIKRIWGNNILFSKSGNIAVVYVVEQPFKYSLDENGFDERTEELFSAFRTTPNDVYIHKQDVYLSNVFDTSSITGDMFLDQALRDHFKGRKGLEHYTILSFVLTGLKSLEKAYLQNPFNYQEKLEQDDKLKLIDFQNSVDKSINILKNIRRVSVYPIDQEDLRYHIYRYVNGFEEAGFYDIDFRDKKIGENYIDLFVFNKAEYFADEISNIKKDDISRESFTFWEGTMDMLGETLDCNHVYNQIIYFKGNKIIESEIDLIKDEYGKVRTSSDRINSKFLQLEAFLKDSADQGTDKVLVKAHFNLMLFDKDKETFNANRQKVRSLLMASSIDFYKPEKEIFKDVFLGSIIGREGQMHKDNFFISHLKQALCLFTNTTLSKSDEEGVYFNDRVYQLPLKRDIWDRKKKRVYARNGIISALTGGGKSVVALNIITQFLSQGINVVVTEFGQSFKFITNLYPDISTHIRYSADKELGINPFTLSEDKLTQQKLSLLISIVLKTWRIKENFEDAHIGVSITKLLQHYYSIRKFGHSYEDFYYYVVEGDQTLLEELDIDPEYFDLKSFKHICSEFVTDGRYENVFKDSQVNADQIRDKQFVVFELTEIKKDPFLVSLISLILGEAIDTNILADRSKRGILINDEFAESQGIRDLYTGEDFLATIAILYQKIRKENGAVWTIIQDIGQLPKNQYTESILANTQILMVLESGGTAYKKLQETFSLSDHEMYMIKSIKNNFNHPTHPYSEQFIKLGDYSEVLRLELSKPAYLAYQTEGEIWADMNQKFIETGDLQKVINDKILQR